MHYRGQGRFIPGGKKSGLRGVLQGMKRLIIAFACFCGLSIMLAATVLSERPSATSAPEILERSCANCHSEGTRWPWYSHVPMVHRMMEQDVAQARDKMNLSRWEEYTAEQRRTMLGSIAANVRNAQMPPARYLLLHPEARLTLAEEKIVEEWTREERRRLREGDGSVPSVRLH
jgi:hypothetical protein